MNSRHDLIIFHVGLDQTALKGVYQCLLFFICTFHDSLIVQALVYLKDLYTSGRLFILEHAAYINLL